MQPPSQLPNSPEDFSEIKYEWKTAEKTRIIKLPKKVSGMYCFENPQPEFGSFIRNIKLVAIETIENGWQHD